MSIKNYFSNLANYPQNLFTVEEAFIVKYPISPDLWKMPKSDMQMMEMCVKMPRLGGTDPDKFDYMYVALDFTSIGHLIGVTGFSHGDGCEL